MKPRRETDKWTSWNKLLSLMAAITLCWAFIEEANDRNIDAWDYIGFSTGMVITYAPVLGVKLIGAFRGKK